MRAVADSPSHVHPRSPPLSAAAAGTDARATASLPPLGADAGADHDRIRKLVKTLVRSTGVTFSASTGRPIYRGGKADLGINALETITRPLWALLPVLHGAHPDALDLWRGESTSCRLGAVVLVGAVLGVCAPGPA